MEKRFIAAAQTDIGIAKQVNQDSLTMKVAKTASYGELAFAVLCDGMGGLAQGELASAHVIRAFEAWFHQSCEAWLKQGQSPKALREQWQNIIQVCNQQIYEYSIAQAKKMGTTLTVMLLTQTKYYIAHIGDCRVYELKEQGIRQMTRDQTYVAREVALGHMTPEQAKTDSRRNVLLQCIGAGRKVEADFICGEVQEQAVYLLCSDGFRHAISLQEMMQFCYANLEQEEFLQQEALLKQVMKQQLQYLIELNKNRDEKDNISAILIKTA